MTVRPPEYRFERHAQCARIAVLVVTALTACVSSAQDLPALRAGLWEINRTIDASASGGPPQTVSTRECTSPNDGMLARQEMLKKIGCTLSPLHQSGNTYTFSAVCSQGAGGTSRSTLTVDNDSAYSIHIESDIAGMPSKEMLRATRVGDCPP
jgi:hypothetical protein